MSSAPESPIANGFKKESLRIPSSEARLSSSTKRHHLNQKESMNGPLYRQTCNNTVLVRRLKRKGNGPSKQLARWFVENQIGMPHAPPMHIPMRNRIGRINRKNLSKAVRSTADPTHYTACCVLHELAPIRPQLDTLCA